MTDLTLDYETFSRVDITETGASVYTRHPSTRALMCAFAYDNEPVQIWVPEEGEKMPRDLRDGLRDPKVIKHAWNASFEKQVTKNTLGIDVYHDEWRCTMVHAMTLSLPGSLDAAGPVVDLSVDKLKDKRGKALIRLFCKPQKPSKKFPGTTRNWFTNPEDWEEFKSYCKQDVVTERAIRRRLYPMSPEEWEMWFIDQEINQAGVPLNMDMVRNAIKLVEYSREKRLTELGNLTGAENPNSNAQILRWLREHGYPFTDMKKAHVERAAEKAEGRLKRVLDLRLEVSKTSVDKYYAFERGADADGMLRNTLQFYGAQRTGRWSGRLGQLQNPPRPEKDLEKIQDVVARHIETLDPESFEMVYGNPLGALATGVRPTIQAPDGTVFADADLSAIENRVVGWMADDQKILDVFRKNRDPYVDFATYLYKSPYDDLFKEYKAGDKTKRTVAKPGTLGCQYMLSAGEEHENEETGEIEATGLLGYARNMGVNLTLEQAQMSVDVWRETFVDVVDFWWTIDKAAKQCVRTGEETRAGDFIRFDRKGPFMRMILPSGRPLYYCRPKLEETFLYWCEEKEQYLPLFRCKRPDKTKYKTKASLTYEGMNDKNKWGRIHTHPGKLTENADQAISRDILAHGIKLARREGLDVRLHVHDQIIALMPENSNSGLQTLLDCMSEVPHWAPGLPLGAAGERNKLWLKD